MLPVISNVPIGQVAYASMGTNTTDAAGQLWITDIFIPYPMVIGTIGFLQGGTATTDNTLVAIFDGEGNRLGTSNLSGVVLSGGNTFQEQALLTPVQCYGPARYYIAVQGNGTAGGAIQTVPTGVYIRLNAGSLAGAFGTVPSKIVPPITFTTNKAPIVYCY